MNRKDYDGIAKALRRMRKSMHDPKALAMIGRLEEELIWTFTQANSTFNEEKFRKAAKG